MRTLAVTQNITLDGSIEFLDDWFDPQARGLGDMSDLQEEVQRQSAASDALLTGRQTFEDFRSYWPHREDDTTGTSAYLDGVAKYVVSSTLTEPGWENTTVLSGDPVEEVGALKETEGNDIVLTGSIKLVHALIEAGLVDEIRLFTFPVVQGRGRRLFPDGFRQDRLRLLEAGAFRSGIVLTTYAVD
jgi:dihydrofolate reductase